MASKHERIKKEAVCAKDCVAVDCKDNNWRAENGYIIVFRVGAKVFQFL